MIEWYRSLVKVLGYPLSGMAEARRHSRSPETQPRPPGREAPGSSSGPDGRRQRARRIGPVWQPSSPWPRQTMRVLKSTTAWAPYDGEGGEVAE